MPPPQAGFNFGATPHHNRNTVNNIVNQMDTASLAHLGLMQKISTGNMVLDMAICLLLPVLLKYLSTYWDILKQLLTQRMEKLPGYVRRIDYCSHEDSCDDEEENSANKALQVDIHDLHQMVLISLRGTTRFCLPNAPYDGAFLCIIGGSSNLSSSPAP